MPRCCCGLFSSDDWTGDSFIHNDTVHEILGPLGNFCGTRDAHSVRDLQAENATLRERLARLQAAAENILFKRKQNVPLEAVDFEWLERAVGEKA